MSDTKKYIQWLHKELKHYRKKATEYKGLYHGTIPDGRIHIKPRDWNKVVAKARIYDKLNTNLRQWNTGDMTTVEYIANNYILLTGLDKLSETSKRDDFNDFRRSF